MIPNTIIPTTGRRAWLNKLRNFGKASTPSSGKGTNTNVTPYGTTINHREKADFRNRIFYDYEIYSPDKAYKRGQIVRNETTYLTGYLPNDDFSDYDTTRPIFSLPGVYICVANVPEFMTGADYQALRGNYSGCPNEVLQHWISLQRKNNWTYAPVWEEPLYSINQYQTTDSKDYQLNQYRFWEFISFLPIESEVCRDGRNIIVLISAAEIPSEDEVADLPKLNGPGLVDVQVYSS